MESRPLIGCGWIAVPAAGFCAGVKYEIPSAATLVYRQETCCDKMAKFFILSKQGDDVPHVRPEGLLFNSIYQQPHSKGQPN